ncbi:MAG: nitroreductase family protein [Chloroflexota bacterium]
MMIESRYSAWYGVLERRRSHRRFDLRQVISSERLAALKRVCGEFRPFPAARSVLVTDSPEDVFKGVVGSYGKVTGARTCIAFIGDMTNPNVQEMAGYTGEGIVLEATALGLNTCWVGGFFRPEVTGKLAGTRENERVLAVTPVGYAKLSPSVHEAVMSGFGRHHRRELLSKLVSGLEESRWPEWVRAALEAARLAPSAVNRQPWMFRVEPEAITVSVRLRGPDFGVSKRLDCGIAMLHIELGAASCGVRGGWEFLKAPVVARFVASA